MADYQQYYSHLKTISWLGKTYKRYYSSQILYYQAAKFGKKIAEIGPGIGNGILGAYQKQVVGFEVNPLAAQHCKDNNLSVQVVAENKRYPVPDGEYDVCVMDNVLEHIAEPAFILKECARITTYNAGLIIAVPGNKGFLSDPDHKKHYPENQLQDLSPDWQLLKIFSMPFFVKCNFLSRSISQYCLVAVYRKITPIDQQ